MRQGNFMYADRVQTMLSAPRSRFLLVCVSAAIILMLYIPWKMSRSNPERRRPAPTTIFVDVDKGKEAMDFFRRHAKENGDALSTSVLEAMTDKEVHTAYHSFLDNMDILCHRKLRMGNVGDGGWEVCDDDTYRPSAPCTVYSFGINNDFSFDDEVGKLYGCDVFSFDPSMNLESHRRSNKVHFYNIGLGGKDGVLEREMSSNGEQLWTVKSLTDIKNMLNHVNKTIDILKMDIEASEWDALPDMAASGELTHVRQLLVEFHIYHPDSTAEMRTRLPMLRTLYGLGFRRFYTHMNPACHRLEPQYAVERVKCYEVYFVNSKLARPAVVGR